MPIFECGDIVRVPFPYADRSVHYHRPAVVVATGVGLDEILIWVAMITAAENRGWPGDVPVADHLAAGLPIPSVVRTAKVTAIEGRRAEGRGQLPANDFLAVRTEIARWLQQSQQYGGLHE
jgi:mRNA interferase MazF